MKKGFICKLISSMMVFPLMFSCSGNNKDQGNDKKEGFDLSEYTVVLPQRVVQRLLDSASSFAEQVVSDESSALPVLSDSDIEEGGKYFLIGDTSRSESAETAALLEDSGTEHSYAITSKDGVISIVGSDTDATMMGMKYFLMNYAENGRGTIGESETYVGGYDGDPVIFTNLVTWTLEAETVIDRPPSANATATMKYPSIIELTHQENEENNGILIATGERWIDEHMCPVYRSTDRGDTWETVTFVSDPFHEDVRTAFAPCLFELPYSVGEMPAGTVILGSNSVNSGWNKGYIVLYRSYDQGSTWEAFTTVASSEASGGEFGVWEPNFVCTEDGTLICYYSDDADPICSQKLVLKYTKDGINWSRQIDTVALENRGLRPGMPVVTRLGNGQYMMVYEIVGLANNPVYFKISDSPIDWGDPKDAGTLILSGSTRNGKSLAATPWCAWSPIGGECGMLVVTGWRMASGTSTTGSDIFVSFDYGKSWLTIPNYYSYTWINDNSTWGYSASIVFSSDGKTMYYMANPQGQRANTTWYKLFRIRVE